MSDATTSVLTTLAVGLDQNGDVVVKYTWGGDADLNGELNGDDYFAIDSNALAQTPGFHNGDFDYNGVIDGDDYFIIDSNITFAHASPPFAQAPLLSLLASPLANDRLDPAAPSLVIGELL